MHELLQHFEDNHVVIESDMDEDEDLPFQFESNQDVEMATDTPFRQLVNPSDIYSNDTVISAFETSIIRKRQGHPSPPQPWRQISGDSPPNTFPLNHDGPTKYIKSDGMEASPPTPQKRPSTPVTEVEEVDRDSRPYKCKIAGCSKSYKNPGGLKYHMSHGHCEDTGDPEMNNIIHKPFQCTVLDCSKRYKNLNGLKVFTTN